LVDCWSAAPVALVGTPRGAPPVGIPTCMPAGLATMADCLKGFVLCGWPATRPCGESVLGGKDATES